ncbi:hypothetical protein ACIBG8_19470 [Nonomuraea sp. NPDC050556]|uniref:hypothetical protein n=1 Tax=Nonomuraea sp. NPDC050556 TaxID=3364369 RepID=UPI003796F75B
MALRFYGKDTLSQSGSCASVHLDDSDGSLVIVGSKEDDPEVLDTIRQVAHIEDYERAIRVPKTVKKALWEACGGLDPDFD